VSKSQGAYGCMGGGTLIVLLAVGMCTKGLFGQNQMVLFKFDRDICNISSTCMEGKEYFILT